MVNFGDAEIRQKLILNGRIENQSRRTGSVEDYGILYRKIASTLQCFTCFKFQETKNRLIIGSGGKNGELSPHLRIGEALKH